MGWSGWWGAAGRVGVGVAGGDSGAEGGGDRGDPGDGRQRVRSSGWGDSRRKTIAAGLWLGSGTWAESSEQSNWSIVSRVSVAGLTVLVIGDVEREGQRTIMEAGGDVRANVLKVPHHGSA